MTRVMLLLVLAACSTRGLDEETPPHDAVAPTLDVQTPLRGSIAAGATSVDVRGHAADDDSGVARVLVNGLPAQLSSDGSFVATVPAPAAGVVLLHTEVFDGAGNSASDTRAVLAGALAPIATEVPNAFHAHLDAGALALVAAAASELLGDLDLDAVAAGMNPLVDLPIPCFAVRVDVTKAKKGQVTLGVVPDNDGLTVDAQVADLEVDLHVAYELACDAGAADLTLTASAFHLSGILAVGESGVSISQATSRIDGFMVSGGLPQAVDDAIEQPLGAALAGLVAALVEDELPAVLGGFLGGEHRIGVRDQTLAFTLTERQLQVDDSGLDVTLDSRVSLPTAAGIVFPVNASHPPALGAVLGMDKPFRAALADDAMNQLLAALWGAGLMDQSFPVHAGSFAGAVQVALRLPPVVRALPGSQGLEVVLGDVEVTITQDTVVVMRLSVSARAAVGASIAGGRLELTAAEPAVWIDVLPDDVTGPNPFGRSAIETLASLAAKKLVAVVVDDAAKLPIPSFGGIGIAAQSSTGLAEGGYLLIAADLARQAP